MVISALIIVGYTTLGGFLAASTTEFYPEHHYVDRTGYCIYLWY